MARAAVESTFSAENQATAAHLVALYDYARLCTVASESSRAQDALRRACLIDAPSDTATRTIRLHCLLEMTEVALMAGDAYEAQHAAREGVELSVSLVGAGHHAWAAATLGLARVRVMAGSLREALLLCDEAMAVLESAGATAVAKALVLRAEILARLRPGAPLLGEAPARQDEETLRALVEESVSPVPPVRWSVRADLLHAVLDRLDARLPALPIRARALQRLVWIHDAHGEPEAAAAVRQDLAAAYLEVGDALQASRTTTMRAILLESLDPAGATRVYGDAVAQAASLGPAEESAVRQMFGSFLATRGKRKSAALQLRAALVCAERTGDYFRVATAQGTLGVFLHHGKRFDEARPMLQSAVANLPPLRREALTARSHLQAHAGESVCSCEDPYVADAAGMMDHIQRAMPPGRGPSSVRVDDGRFQLEFDVELSDEESTLLDRLLRDGMRLLRGNTGAFLLDPDPDVPPESTRLRKRP
ncbi:MAG: hypothetical protein WKG00_36395 [Polyangiaceae bacterium]